MLKTAGINAKFEVVFLDNFRGERKFYLQVAFGSKLRHIKITPEQFYSLRYKAQWRPTVKAAKKKRPRLVVNNVQETMVGFVYGLPLRNSKGADEVIVNAPDDIEYRLYGTTIADIEDGVLTIDNHGYTTKTTGDRMCRAFENIRADRKYDWLPLYREIVSRIRVAASYWAYANLCEHSYPLKIDLKTGKVLSDIDTESVINKFLRKRKFVTSYHDALKNLERYDKQDNEPWPSAYVSAVDAKLIMAEMKEG